MRSEFEKNARRHFMRKNCLKATILFLAMACLNLSRAQDVPLVTINTTWRYAQTGVDPGANWTARTGYNDAGAGWEGPGLPLFGFESDEAQYAGVGAPVFNVRFPDSQNPNTNFRT